MDGEAAARVARHLGPPVCFSSGDDVIEKREIGRKELSRIYRIGRTGPGSIPVDYD
jgi:hypothetical protein